MPVESTGQSDTLSFDEAFKDAIAGLEGKVPNYPDHLLRVVVSEIRGDFGGIQGLTRLSVTVVANE